MARRFLCQETARAAMELDSKRTASRRRRVMSTAWVASAMLFVLALPLAVARAELGKAGSQAAVSPADGLPKVSLTDQKGRAIALSSLKGKRSEEHTSELQS